MRQIFALAGLGAVAWLGWQIGGVLSSDALGMALGVILGMMAGIPAALIAMSAQRAQKQAIKALLEAAQKPTGRIFVLSTASTAPALPAAEHDVLVLPASKVK